MLALPVTLSENLAPIVINKSHSVIPRLDVLVPCIPTIPVYLESLPSNAPLPIRVSATGLSTLSTNSLSSVAASDITAPPPTKINGFLDLLIILTASSKSSSLILSTLGLTGSISAFTYSASLAVTSLVISTSTGPGRPVLAILNALLNVLANFVTSLTIKLCFVIGIVTPAISIS